MTNEQAIVFTPPTSCDFADVELAHELMRRHRKCHRGKCVWKAAAHQTLVLAGRLTPQSMTPRERAARRGIEFPVLRTDPAHGEYPPGHETLREVLDRLTALATGS